MADAPRSMTAPMMTMACRVAAFAFSTGCAPNRSNESNRSSESNRSNRSND